MNEIVKIEEYRSEDGSIIENPDWSKQMMIRLETDNDRPIGILIDIPPDILEKRAQDQYLNLQNSQFPVAISMFVQSTPMTRQAAISVSTFYDEWSDKSVEYKKGQWVRYKGDLYQVESDHTSQASWTPDVSPSLFTRFKLAADGIRIWEQPTHAENAFDVGERCYYPDEAGGLYESKIDGNTTVPGSDGRYWNKLPE